MGMGARGRTSTHRVLWWAFGRVPLLWSDASHARLDERSMDRTSVSTHILAVLLCSERPVQWYLRLCWALSIQSSEAECVWGAGDVTWLTGGQQVPDPVLTQSWAPGLARAMVFLLAFLESLESQLVSS